MTKQTEPPPPSGLAPAQKRLWAEILEDFEPSAGELRILVDAMFLCQRADECADVIAAEGVATTDRYGGRRSHPSLDAEIRCRTSAASLLHKLGVRLPDDAHPLRNGAKRGPRPKSQTAAARP